MATDTTPQWVITGQFPDAGPDATGRYGAGMTVTYSVPGVGTGQAFFPQAEYTPPNVREKIAAQVATMLAIRDSGK